MGIYMLKLVHFGWGLTIQVFGDSRTISINQVLQIFRCSNISMVAYYAAAQEFITCFQEVEFQDLPREANSEANEMTQITSGISILEGQIRKILFTVHGRKRNVG